MSAAAPAALPVPSRVIRRRTRRRMGETTSHRIDVRPAYPWVKGQIERFLKECSRDLQRPFVRRAPAGDATVTMSELQRLVLQGVIHTESWDRGLPEAVIFDNARSEAFHV